MSVRPLSTGFERPWQLGEVLENWRRANVSPFLKRGRKEGPGNYRPVSLNLFLAKVMEQLILATTTRHMNDKVIGSSHQGEFMLNKLYNLL